MWPNSGADAQICRMPLWSFMRALIAAVCIWTGLHGSAVVAAPASTTDTTSTTAPEIESLRKKVDPIISGTDDVELRHHADEVFRLIDDLLNHRREAEALKYLNRMLQADPRAFNYQLTYGEILARRGQPEVLESRAKQAIQSAEDDGTLRRAYRLASVVPPQPVPALLKRGDDIPELVLIQIEGVSQFWLEDLQKVLARRLGMRVIIVQTAFSMGPASRTGETALAEEIRKRLIQGIDDDQSLAAYMKGRGYVRRELETNDREVLQAYRIVLNRWSTAKNVKDFDDAVEKARASGYQWNADSVLDRLAGTLQPYRGPKRWFMGVTDDDLYAKSSRYLFGTAYTGGDVAVISAARFSAKFYDESPDRPRLERRLVKQALSSFGFMLGVPRCSDPDCARAFPNSVADQDAKSDQLCDKCRAGFALALGHSVN